jgi:outer membrane protein OmpA-like peptidoglycan-associated protein
MDLNLEAESFESYVPFQDEEAERYGGHGPVVHGGSGLHLHGGHGSHHGGSHHGGSHRGRHHSGFRHHGGRWPWLQSGSGADDGAQDPQSISWAQGCLSQLTGNMVPQSGQLDPATQSAIAMFQSQQQLPATGTLDDATMSALQSACGDQGAQGATGEIAPGPAPSDRRVLWFELNSTKLRQDSEADSTIHLALVVGECLRHLKAKGNAARIILYGFASHEGAETRNRQLAGQRAQHVKEMLVAAGVPEDRIQIVNGGPNNNWPTLKWNRRVEVELQPQP